jgi:hypothetical protein
MSEALMRGDEQSLVLPTKREALLTKFNEFKTKNLNSREQEERDILARKINILLCLLYWSKLGVSLEQLKKLDEQDLNEAAVMMHERSRIYAFIQTVILMCFPVIGWLILGTALGEPGCMPTCNPCFQNMRYYWWYRRMKNKYNEVFEPDKDELSRARSSS